MMAERLLWDRYLFQIRVSGLISDGGKILDIGTGMNTTILEMFGDNFAVTSSDINVGKWNAHIPDMIEVDAMNIDQSDAANSKWDAVILSEVLEHVLEPKRVLSQARNILAPDGVVIITMPFWYRIHEYGDLDPETVEPGLRDYWRITPHGMEHLLREASYDHFWVGRLVAGDKRTFPEFYCPSGVVAWAKSTGSKKIVLVPEHDWNPPLPEDWRQHQIAMAKRWGDGNVNTE